MLTSLYRYRSYILHASIEELRHRYAGSALGVAWNVAIPLIQIGIYALIFTALYAGHHAGAFDGRLADSPFAYVFFLCSGFLPWFGFADCITTGTNTLLSNARYLTRLAMDESIFLAKSALTSAITTLIALLLLTLLGLPAGLPVGLAYLFLPAVLALFMAFAFGIIMVLGTLNVFFRDTRQAIGLLLHMWMWLTPIIYVEDQLPAFIRPWLPLNPTYSFIAAFRQIFLHNQVPPPATWAAMLGWTVLSIALGWAVLGRLRHELRDAL